MSDSDKTFLWPVPEFPVDRRVEPVLKERLLANLDSVDPQVVLHIVEGQHKLTPKMVVDTARAMGIITSTQREDLEITVSFIANLLAYQFNSPMACNEFIKELQELANK